MKNFWLPILIILSLFLSCSENINEPISNDDSELISNIIGTWSTNTYKVTHFSNLTFEDTSFFFDDNSQVFKPRYSRNGTFEISDSVLYLKTNHWIFFDSSFIANGISIVPTESEISISGNVLYKKPVDVLDNVEGNESEIWGSWKNIKWTYHKSGSAANIVYEGRQEYYYKFYKDSSTVIYGWKYLDGNPWSNPEFKSEFKYIPPLLDLYGPGEYDLRVVFKNGKMYWYRNFPAIQLNRVF